jgi:hypothetical protein
MFYIGADPEVFVLNRNENCIISGDTMLQKSGVDLQWGNIGSDGLAIEIRPNPVEVVDPFYVYNDSAALMYNIADIEKMFLQNFTFAEFIKKPLIPVTKEILETAGEDANRFGCEPDIDVYLQQQCNEKDASQIMVRTAGGHIHIGFHENNPVFNSIEPFIEMQETIIKLFDIAISLPLMTCESIEGFKRRALYGQPGAYRIQKWGIEYRTLGNNLFYNNSDLIYSSALAILGKISNNVKEGEKMLNNANDIIKEDEVVAAIMGKHTVSAKKITELRYALQI